MQKIVPHLWFDTQAVEAANWYVSLFEHSRILRVSSLEGTPSGKVDAVEFELDGVAFSAISAGPYFSLNASVSLMVTCRSVEEVDRLYANLSPGATELMPLGEYPFSKRYVWLADRYGVNWQLTCFETDEITQKIRPNLLFAGDVCGKAEEALKLYEEALEIASPLADRDHICIAEISMNLGLLYLQGGDPLRAKPFFETALPVFDKNYGPEHMKTRLAKSKLESVLAAQIPQSGV